MAKPNRGDFTKITESIIAELRRREGRRDNTERLWKEVDRQVEMVADISFKMLLDSAGHITNAIDPEKAWMPEIEMPWQAGALEVLIADARRMMFPENGSYYRARAFVTDDYLERAELTPIVGGDRIGVPSNLPQDDVDKLTEAFGLHWQRQYDYRGAWDKLNAQAFRYGAFAARGRLVRRSVPILDAKGNLKSLTQRVPMLIPKNIKNVYLDDRRARFAGEGFEMSPLTIEKTWIHLEDLKRAAAKGETEPTHENGGWMPKLLEGLEPDDQGGVTIVRAEGDVVVPRKTVKSALFNNVTVHIAMGKGSQSLYRFQTRTPPSYIEHSYLSEGIDNPYSPSPLIKGAKVQKAAVHALTQFFAWAALNVRPPLGYSPDDADFAANGLNVEPGAKWETTDGVKVFQIGEGDPIFTAFQQFKQDHSDVTGVNAPRLGQQTVSHTTAFAKDVELQRGTARTVNYVRGVNQHPMIRWLQMEYGLGKQGMGKTETFPIPAYQGVVEIEKKHLPDDVMFEVFGSAGPAEEQGQFQERVQAIQLAQAMEEAKLQLNPEAPPLDFGKLQEILLRKAFPDAEELFVSPPEDVQGGAATEPDLQTAVEGVAGPAIGVLEALG